MKRKVLICFMFGFGLFSQDVSGQTDLGNLINYALEHSREIRKSELQIQEANYMRKEAIGYGLPQIEGSASYSKMMFDKIEIPASAYTAVPSEYAPMLDKLGNIDKFYSTSAGVQVTQLIYSQSYWLGVQTAKKMQELYSILKNKSEEELIAEVANSYYQAGSLMLNLQTVEKTVKNLEEIFRIAQLNYNNDLIKETDVSRLRVTITNLEVTGQTLQNVISTQINYLKALAGMPGDSSITIDPASFIPDSGNKLVNSEFQIENIPSYQALMIQADIYEQQTKLSKAKYYPTLAAFGNFNYSSYNISSDIDSWNKITTVGLSLSVPIFSSGVNHAKVNQSLLKQKQLYEDISQTKDFLRVDYQNAFSEYQTARNLLVVQRDNKELAQKVYRQTMLQYEEGMASLADLLNVNSDFLQADNSYNQQVLKCKTSEIKMLKSTGNLMRIVNTK
ncbi:MAG: TolC family protein [Rikenellaceae bacterium]